MLKSRYIPIIAGFSLSAPVWLQTPAQTDNANNQRAGQQQQHGDVIMSGPFSSSFSRSANVGDVVVVVAVAARRLQLCYYYRSCTCPQLPTIRCCRYAVRRANRFDHSLEPLLGVANQEEEVASPSDGRGCARGVPEGVSSEGRWLSSSSTLNVINRANFFNWASAKCERQKRSDNQN